MAHIYTFKPKKNLLNNNDNMNDKIQNWLDIFANLYWLIKFLWM